MDKLLSTNKDENTDLIKGIIANREVYESILKSKNESDKKNIKEKSKELLNMFISGIPLSEIDLYLMTETDPDSVLECIKDCIDISVSEKSISKTVWQNMKASVFYNPLMLKRVNSGERDNRIYKEIVKKVSEMGKIKSDEYSIVLSQITNVEI